MSTLNLIILSYHKFVAEESDYVFSRTFKQFRNDIETKDFDQIHIDDAKHGTIKACKMLHDLNYRAKIFVSSALVGTPGFLSWDDLWRLSRTHDIENHSHEHIMLTELMEPDIYDNIKTCSDLIFQHIEKRPRYFIAPYNTHNEAVERIAAELGLQVIKDRITIKNISR